MIALILLMPIAIVWPFSFKELCKTDVLEEPMWHVFTRFFAFFGWISWLLWFVQFCAVLEYYFNYGKMFW